MSTGRDSADDPDDRAGAPLGPDPAARIAALEDRLKKLRRREERNLRHARAHGFLDGVLAMLSPGDVAIDCGANLGEVSARLAATGARVIAFEPDPYAFAQLSERLGGLPNVELRQEAVAHRAGRLRLMRAANFGDNPDGASVKSTLLAGGRGIDESQGIEVDVIDLPAFLGRLIAEHGRVAFLKLDVEGAELDLLAAMDEQDLFGGIRCTVAETHERKFKGLRDSYRALRERLGQKYAPQHVNLDWI